MNLHNDIHSRVNPHFRKGFECINGRKNKADFCRKAQAETESESIEVAVSQLR